MLLLLLLLVMVMWSGHGCCHCAVHQFVLGISKVPVIIVVIVIVTYVDIVGCGDATRITAPTAGEGDLLLRSTAHLCGGRVDTPWTGRFRFGDIVPVDFQFGHFGLF